MNKNMKIENKFEVKEKEQNDSQNKQKETQLFC
jgi:hypothetical protein